MKCSGCGKDKEAEEFSFKSKIKNKRQSQCKECHKEYTKLHYKNNKSEYVARAKISTPKYYKRNQQLMVEYLLGKECVDCGEKDICTLDFDHRDPCDKSNNISSMMQSYSWEGILREISKCDVRCANCHRRRTAKQFGTYRALFSQV